MRYMVRITFILSLLSVLLLISTFRSLRPRPQSRQIPQFGTDEVGYVFYATNNLYACSALVNVHRLRRLLRTRFPIYLLVSSGVSTKYRNQFQNSLYNVTVIEHEPPPLPGDSSDYYYRDVLLKLVSFQLHRWAPRLKRIIVLDSDQLVLRSLDELFTKIPHEVDVAAAHAYWLPGNPAATSAMMVISPSEPLWRRMNSTIVNMTAQQYDMDLINAEFGTDMMLLPGEYATLNSHWETFDIPSWSRFAEHETKWPPVGKKGLDVPSVGMRMSKSRSGSDPGTSQHGAGDGDRDGTHDLDSGDKALRPASSLDNAGSGSGSGPGSKAKAKARPGSALFRYDRALVDPLTSIFYADVYVLHFTALGKPWSVRVRSVYEQRPDAHPLFAEQFLLWRTAARELCPALELGEAGSFQVVGKRYFADFDFDVAGPDTSANSTMVILDRFLDEI